jgi:excisionase family DNA binding protein
MMQDTRPAHTIDERFAISILEAAKVLGISRSYAYQMAATGELPTLRLGRRILVPVAALRELVGLDH